MFAERRRRRDLLNGIEEEKERLSKLRIREGVDLSDTRKELQGRIDALTYYLAYFDTRVLLEKATRYGIEVPANPAWWNDDAYAQLQGDLVERALTEFGHATLTKLVREERRKNIEWWVKIITPVLAALISVLGLIVALVAVSRK